MNSQNCIDLSSLVFGNQPFAHFTCTEILRDNVDALLFDWLGQTGEWYLSETDFYEQYEFNFLRAQLPEQLQCMVSKETINIIQNKFETYFKIDSLELVGVMAHKLIHDQKIGIHNDFINGEETHRLVIHVNPEWKQENGGYLMLFNSSKVEDIAKVIPPVNNFALGFEISGQSHHAVSKIYDFLRYTVIYTFRKN
jgi:Rps23 Pro-64 3,4-dihydroxylase Tpa1-like proline 4-hydroxylase